MKGKKFMYRSHVRAFSLIELLLVLVILGVLAALVVPKFTDRSRQARETAAKTDITNIETAISMFMIDTDRYPSEQEGLNELLVRPSDVREWNGPYLPRGMPKDPWGNEYKYRYPGQRNPSGFDLYSMGPSGRDGTDDIGNWSGD